MPRKTTGHVEPLKATTKKKPSAARRVVNRKMVEIQAAVAPAFVEPLKGYKSNLLTWAGWFMGAMSLLGLNEELRWVKIEKGLQSFIANYSSVVGWITKFLFGWIDWHWIRVSALEGHVMVITALVALATIRAGYKSTVRRHDTVEASAAMSMLMLVPVIAIVIFIPDPPSLFFAGGWFALMASMLLFSDRNAASGKPLPLAEAREIQLELLGILAMTFILVAASRMLE